MRKVSNQPRFMAVSFFRHYQLREIAKEKESDFGSWAKNIYFLLEQELI